MSNKNLKVYRIQFITEVQDMQFKVKFPCQVKMIWKRSNQSAQTTLVQVENGVVHFNQTLKMYVNMYFDTTTNRFVQKKCMYSFLIITDKGEKSAGSITYDLSQFFNKRIYELEQQFPLQKCPLPDTKIKMKIYYEESTQAGYDSMSRISTSSQLDLSTTSMDVNQLNENQNSSKSFSSQNKKSSSSIDDNKSKKSQQDTASKQISSQKNKEDNQSNFDLLNQSDLGVNVDLKVDSNIDLGKNQKITENIQALNKITGKINDFVSKCSGNIKIQIQNLKHKNKTLEEQLISSKIDIQKLTKQKQENKNTISQLNKQLGSFKIKYESQIKIQKEKYQQLQHKYQQSQRLSSELQKNLQQKGQSQSSYLTQLKSSFAQTEKKNRQKIQSLNNQLLNQKKQISQLNNKIGKLKQTNSDYKEKILQLQERNRVYQTRQSQRQKQLADLRSKLQHVYQDIVKSFGNFASN